MLAALAERDPLGQGILEASRLRKEKAALERPSYHLIAGTPALVHALSAAAAAAAVVVAAAAVAAAAAAWQGKDNSKEDEAAMPMFEQGMDTEEG
jgi:hypothetical protein